MPEKETPRFKLPYPTTVGKVQLGAKDFEELVMRLDSLLYKPGDLRFTAKASIDEGWMACEGQEISRTTYAELFASVGTAYGEGNKTSTFNLPDYRGRVPLGAGKGTGGEEAETFPTRTRGQKIGALLKKLTTKQMPEHIHDLAGYVPSTPSTEVELKAITVASPGSNWTWGPEGNVEAHIEQTRVTRNNGSSEAHGIVQPGTVCNVWIKT